MKHAKYNWCDTTPSWINGILKIWASMTCFSIQQQIIKHSKHRQVRIEGEAEEIVTIHVIEAGA